MPPSRQKKATVLLPSMIVPMYHRFLIPLSYIGALLTASQFHPAPEVDTPNAVSSDLTELQSYAVRRWFDFIRNTSSRYHSLALESCIPIHSPFATAGYRRHPRSWLLAGYQSSVAPCSVPTITLLDANPAEITDPPRPLIRSACASCDQKGQRFCPIRMHMHSLLAYRAIELAIPTPPTVVSLAQS